MANRKLLEENTVSKFMKLAKIDSSRSKRFLTEMYGEEEEGGIPKSEEEEYSYSMDEMGGAYEEEEGRMPREEKEEDEYSSMSLDELDLDKYLNETDDADKDDVGGDKDMGELSMTSDEAKDVVSALEKLLAKLKTAVESSPEDKSEEGPEDTEPSAGAGEAEAPADLGGEAGMETPPASPGELKEALVNRVARRVAARLLRESKKRR